MLKRQLFLLTLILFVSVNLYSQIVEPVYKYGTGLYEESKLVYNSGLLRQSEIMVYEVLKDYTHTPSYNSAFIHSALVDMSLGHYEMAEQKLTKYIRENKTSPLISVAAFNRGLISFIQDKYEHSAGFFQEAAIIAEKEVEIRSDYEQSVQMNKLIANTSLFWQGVSLGLLGRYQDARPIFEECYQKYPESKFADDALFALGQISEINRKYDKALTYYRQAAMFYPYSNSILATKVRTANINLILKGHQEAILNLESAKNITNHIHAKDSIGALYEKQTGIERAHENILYLTGEAYNLQKNYPEALKSFTAFLETFRDSELIDYVRLGAGWAHLNMTNYAEALIFYDAIINSENKNLGKIVSTAQLYRTVALKRQGNIVQAQKELSALSVRPTYPYLSQVLLELGQIYYEKGDYELARRTLERADRESIDAVVTTRINLLLGNTYMLLEMWNKAVAEFRKAEQLAENSSPIFMPDRDWYIAEARLKAGISLVENHRSSEALTSLLAYIGSNKSNRKTDEALYWLAEAYYRSNLIKNASEIYRSLIDLHPNSKYREDALYSLGWSYFKMKQFNNASNLFDKLLKEFPNSKYAVEALTRQGDGFYYVKNYSRAAESYKRASLMAPGTDDGQYASYQLCYSLYKLGRYDNAISSLLDFVRKYNNSSLAPHSLYLIGWIRFQQKNFQEAIDDFEYMIQAYPQTGLLARTFYAIADCYYNMGNYETAMEKYRYVIMTYPSNPLAPEAMKSVQQCLLLLGRDEEAAAILDTFITGNDESPYVIDFRWKKANMFFAGGKYNDAVFALEDLINKHPGSDKAVDALYWMGKSYVNLNEPDKAVKAFDKLRQKYPNSDYASLGMIEMGMMYKNHANIESADSILALVQVYYPEHENAAQAGFERAIMKYNVGDTSASLDLYRAVADSFPTTKFGEQSRYRLGMYYWSKEKNDSSRSEFYRLIGNEFNPNLAAQSYYRIGVLWMREDSLDQAIEAFVTVRDKYSGFEDWFSLSLLALGEAYEKKENYILAREVYQALVALRPGDDFGKTADRRLKRIIDKE